MLWGTLAHSSGHQVRDSYFSILGPNILENGLTGSIWSGVQVWKAVMSQGRSGPASTCKTRFQPKEAGSTPSLPPTAHCSGTLRLS